MIDFFSFFVILSEFTFVTFDFDSCFIIRVTYTANVSVVSLLLF